MSGGSGEKKQLGKIMLQQKLVSSEQLAEMLEDQKRSPGQKLASVATEGGKLPVDSALAALAEQHGVPPVDLSELVIDLSLLVLLPEEIAREHLVLPVAAEGEQVWLAMAAPDAEKVVEEVEFLTAKGVVRHVALEEVLRTTIDEAYRLQAEGQAFYAGRRVDDATRATYGLPPRPAEAESPAGPESATADPEGEGDLLAVESEDRILSDSPPLDPAFSEPPRPSSYPELGASYAERKVLVADSEGGDCAAFEAALSAVGIPTLTAPDGIVALQAVRDYEPDLVIVNAVLPEVHGLEVCRRLKASGSYTHIPTIVVSDAYHGWRFEEDLRESYGVLRFFSKPVDLHRLSQVVRVVLEGKELVEEIPPLRIEAEKAWSRAMEAFEAGKLHEAIDYLKAGTAVDPEAFELRYHLGLLYGRRDQLFSAIRALEEAVELQPRHFSALKNLAVVYQRAGFRRMAVDIWGRALACAPDEETRANIKEHLVSLL